MEVCLMGTFTLSDIVAEKYSFMTGEWIKWSLGVT